MWKTAPDPVDVQDLQFKLCAKIEIFNNKDNGRFSKHCNLVASASRFDLIIVGTISNTIQVIRVKSLQEHVKNEGDKAGYPRREISIPSPARHISVNCEETILAVIIERDNTPWALFYDIKSFLQQSLIKLEEIRLSPTPGVEILDINWNPTLSTIFSACKSDGSLGVYELKQPGVNINELPVASGTTCFCWSPKGKQIAVGSKDGKITQYKPDLKAVKVINAPPLKTVHKVIGLQWISNCQFIGIFQSQNTDDPVNLIVIEAPKTGEPSFINFDDICYSNGNTRPTQFYTILQRNWNLLMVASSNSMEVGVLNCTNDIWTQWIMGDASRAELPLNDNHEESLPIGLSLNTSSTEDIPWGESNLPPSPILLLLSHFGTLCCFNVIYLKTDIPTVCSPPDPIVQTINPNLFTTKSITMNNENVTIPQVSQQPAQAPKITSFTNLENQVKPQQVQKTQSLSFGAGQTSPMVNKSITVTTSTVTTPITPISTSVSMPKAEISQLSETTIQEKNQSEIDAEAEKLFAQMVREECLFLESEIKQLLTRCKSLKIYVGSENDKTNIVQLTTIIDEFLKEIVDITTGQNAEVHSLKQNLLQSFAWYEEAKSRFNASQDKTIAILQRAQPLDSASAKQLADIRCSNYYLESQLIQANRALDEQWENFQDYCRKTYKIKIPTMEAIFQTMVNQMAVIQKQNYILKDISNRIKYRSRQPLGSSLLINVDDPKELENELKRLTLEPKSILDIQIEIVKNRSKYFTKTKANNLRNYLKNRKFPNVTLIKPQMSNITIQESSASKLKQLSLLGAKLSPVSKDVARKLDFIQSTPKQETSKIITTPIEGLEKFTQNFEQNNFKTSETTSFTTTTALSFPIKTTTLSSGPNSAFVSTFTTSSASATNALTTKPVMIVSSVAKTAPTFGVNLTNQPTVSNIDTSRPFSFNFTTKTTTVGATTSTTTTTTTTTPRTLLFTFTTQPTTMTTTAGKTFTFNFGDKSAPTSNSIFKPTTTTTSIFNIGTTKAPVFGSKSLFTSLAPTVTTTIISTITTTKPAQSLFSNTSSLLPQTTISLKSTESVPIVTTITSSIPVQTQSATTTTTTSATSLFGNASFAPKTTSTATTVTRIATIGQSTIFATTPKTTTITTTAVTTTKPSFTITPITPTSSQQVAVTTGAPTTTTSAPQATLIFATKPSTTNITTTTVTVTSATSPAFASVAPTIKTPVSTTGATTSNITTTTTSVFSSVSTTAQPLNLVTSTKPSSFTPVTTQTSIFSAAAAAATSTPVTQTSIFADKQKSFFGTSTTLTTTTTTSIFGTSTVSVASTVSKPSIFSSAPVFGSTAPTTTTSIFGTATTTTTSTTTTTTTTTSIFASTTPATTSSIFGTATASTTSAPSIFGSSTTATTTSATSIFANATPATTSASIFGTSVPTTTTTTAPSIFGGFAQTATVAKPAFGATAPTTTSSIFGTTVSTSSPSIFGGTATSTTKFGSTTFGTVPASTAASPFNQQSSVFGQASSVFGSNTSFGSSPSSFGAVAAATTNSFSFGQSSGSVFGNAPTTSTGSIFGSTPTTSSGFGAAPVFGGAPTSTLSPFGATAPTVSTPSSFSFSNAAASNTTSSGFGFGNLSVGSTPTTSTFGTTPANPFGTAASSTFGATPVSSSSGSIFGSGSVFGANTSTSTFGGTSPPAFGSPSTFGQQSTFGQTGFGSNTSSTGSFFGGSATTTGPFSGGTAGVGQTGFGTATGSSFQSSSGFGSPPVFGSPAPAFGGTPSFGGAPTFGSTATFGSPTRVFGAANSTFGSSSTAQSPSFGNLANQPTVGFGNLAQQASGQSNSAPFSGSSSFSSWR